MDDIKKGLDGLSISLKQAEKAIDLSIATIGEIMSEAMTKADLDQQKKLIEQQKQINEFIKQAKQGNDIHKIINSTIKNIENQLKDLENAC